MPRRNVDKSGAKSIFATLGDIKYDPELLKDLEKDEPGVTEFVKRMQHQPQARPEPRVAISVSVSASSVQALDELAHEKGLTRSAMLDELLKSVARARRGIQNP